MVKVLKANNGTSTSAWKKASLLFLCLMCMGVLPIWAQNIQISGVVTEGDTKEPIPGVNIQIEGTTSGVITDFDGKYTLSAPSNATLIYSFIGFLPQKIAVNGQKTIDVKLQPDTKQLDEVVAIGYGTAKKKDLTGAVSSVGDKVLKDIPVSSTAQAITGRMAGVQVTATEGSPDAEIKIRVRGGGSISQDNSPLYIVDGFPVSTISDINPADIQTIDVLKDASSTAIYGARGANGVFIITTKKGQEGKIKVSFDSYVGVKKIAKVLEVLSPYEYVNYQYELDQSNTFKNYYGVYEDLDIYKSDKGTNWQDELFGREAIQQNYNLSINGGSKTTKFNLGVARTDEESIMIGSGYERNNINFKINSDLSDKLSFEFNTRMAYSIIDGAGVSSGSGATTRLRNAVKYAPTRGLRGFDSSLEDEDDLISPESQSLLYNPVESTNDEYKQQRRFSNNYNAALNWEIINGLSFRTELGYEFRFNKTDEVWGPATSQAKSYGGQPLASIESLEGQSWRNANVLTYQKNDLFAGHDMTFMIGEEMTSSQTKSVTNESRFFPLGMEAEDVLAMMNLAAEPQSTVTKIGEPDNMLSYFGRASWSAYDKYLAQFTLRADASSRFAEGNQWGYFPSASVAWRISQESFMQSTSNWLSNLKLRASYGEAGNNRIGAGLWKTTWNTTGDSRPYYPNETEGQYLIPGSSLMNPELKWETTLTQNVGLDFGFFNNRLSGAVDVYYNITKDLLMAFPVPTSSGYSTQYRNIGQTSNKGAELTLEGVIIDSKDFSLGANFNISVNRNNVDEFRNGTENWKTYTSGWNGSAQPQDDYIVREGEPVGQMYGYVTDGMYSFDDFTFNWVYDSNGEPTSASKWVLNSGVPDNSALTSTGNYFGPGAVKFKDISGPDGSPDGKIDIYDKKVIGNAMPKHSGGFGLNARYKSFDLSAFFNWSVGNKVYNANKLDFSSYLLTRKYQNILDIMSLDNRFTTIDPSTGNNIYYGANANPELLAELNQDASIWHPIMTTTPLHSWAIEDGSFLRINNVTLGYTLPESILSKIKISKLRFYVTGYNLYTFTKYSGFDPEVDTRRSTPMTPGVDYSAYPKSFSVIGGVNVTF